MSRNIKITSLDQAEDFINRQNAQLRHLETQIAHAGQQAKAAAEAEAARRMQEIQLELNQMEDVLSKQLDEQQSQIEKLDTEHRRLLTDQAAEFYEQLCGLKSYTLAQLNKLNKKLGDAVATQRKRIDLLFDKEESSERQAKQLLRDVDTLFTAVESRTAHAKYAPNRMNQLARRIKSSHEGLPSQTLISGAIQVINDLWDLEEDILPQQVKFEARYAMVLAEAVALLKVMSDARNKGRFSDQHGGALKFELDFWTKGAYKKLEDNVTELKKKLETEKDSPELNLEAVELIASDLKKMDAEQQSLICLAVERGLKSEERLIISEEIINALLDQGFSLVGMPDGLPAHNFLGGEEQADQREGVFAILKNGAGMEITLIVQPDETLTKNKVLFQRNDQRELTEGDLLRSLTEVSRIIHGKGYTLGEFAAPAGTGDIKQAELFDPSALQATGLSKEFKQKSGLFKYNN